MVVSISSYAVCLLTCALLLTATVSFGALTSEKVLSDLNVPVAFAFDSKGRIFYCEKQTGKIMHETSVGGPIELFFKVPGVTKFLYEGGCIGITLDKNDSYVYVVVNRAFKKFVTVQQVLRIPTSVENATVQDMEIVLTDKFRSNAFHQGGKLAFDLNNKDLLYFFTGDNTDPKNAQMLSNIRGKLSVLDVSKPLPLKSLPKFISIGNRNSFGFAQDPLKRTNIFLGENGPNCNDEITVLKTSWKNRNCGWGAVKRKRGLVTPACPREFPSGTTNEGKMRYTNKVGRDIEFPDFWFVKTLGITGMAFCNNCKMPAYEGKLFLGSYNDRSIRVFDLKNNRDSLDGISETYENKQGFGIASLEVNPVTKEIFFSDRNSIFKLKQV